MTKRILIKIIFFQLVLGTNTVFAKPGETSSLNTFQNNKKAEELMKEKEPHFLEARDLLLKALVDDPYSPELHLNLGLSLEGLGQLEKAIASYKTAEKLTSRDEIKFLSLFNQAQALAKLKRIDEALEHYQKALNFNPSSAEVKTNIELLMQKQQQQQGGEGGDGKPDQDQQNKDDKDKEGKGDQDKKNEKEPQKFAENPKPGKEQKQKFESKELGENDVRKILDELKSQEQRIRQDFDKQGKTRESERGKDW